MLKADFKRNVDSKTLFQFQNFANLDTESLPQSIRHKTLSLKVIYIEFDLDVSDCTMQVVTHKSKIKMMPYNSVQMINSTLSFDVLLPRGTLKSKTLHRS